MKAIEALKAEILPRTAKEIRQWVKVGVEIEYICLGLEQSSKSKTELSNFKGNNSAVITSE